MGNPNQKDKTVTLNSNNLESVAGILSSFSIGERFAIELKNEMFDAILAGVAKDASCKMLFNDLNNGGQERAIALPSIHRMIHLNSGNVVAFINHSGH